MRRAKEIDWQGALSLALHARRRGFTSRHEGESFSHLRVRVGGLWVVLWAVSALVVARLMYLQMFEGSRNLLLAQTNRVEVDVEYAPRGVIYDRNGEVLVRNVLRSRIFDGTEEEIITREYTLGSAGAHLVGYIDEVKEGETGCIGGLCYEPGDYRGRAGVEAYFEEILRGVDGGRLVEVDSGGSEVREIGSHDPRKGEDVYLSVDAKMQEVMSSALGEKKGSAVLIDMQGKVIGMVSNPSFDPNLFTVRKDAKELQDLLSDGENMPFLNRAIGGAYPPGSVFKLVTAHAGLAEEVIDKSTEIEDTGEIRIDSYRYGNWYFDQYGRTEGSLAIERALARSNDIFFYKVGEGLGINKLVEWAREFGLGERSGIELAGELEGLVPDPLWKERFIGERWFLGNTYHVAIGQGDLLVTPLQIARMTAAAVSGRICNISVVRDNDPFCDSLNLLTSDIELVKSGMRQACEEGGTAFPFFDFEPRVLCKTGTAQHGGEETLPHAWISVVYPGDNPQVVLVVMLEEAGEGSAEAGPVARAILDEWKEL